MIDKDSLRPSESRQLNPKANPEDQKYLDRVHAFIDEQFDQLLAEIGQKIRPELGYSGIGRTGSVGSELIAYHRKEKHHRLNYPFQWGPVYWPSHSEVYDQGVVDTVNLCERMREEWGEPKREKGELERMNPDPDAGRLHYEALIRRDQR